MNASVPVLRLALLLGLVAAPLPVTGATFFDNFDSYAAGSNVHGQGGWRGWDNAPAAGAVVSSAFSSSAANSLNVTGGSDVVQSFTGASSGVWTFSLMQYVPTGSTGTSYLILMNQYTDVVGPYNWSVQTTFNLDTGVVGSDMAPGTQPLIRDQWVPYRAVIDLGADTVSEYYNNALVVTHPWKSGTESTLTIAAVDLFANGAGPVYYDNVSLVPEPSSLMLLASGACGLCALRRRRAAA